MIVLLAVALLADGDICPNATTTVEISVCVASEYKIADGEMTKAWRLASGRARNADTAAIARKAPGGYFAALLDAQRKWIAFRDAHCRVESYRMRGGSGEGYSQGICLITLTNDRRRQLDNLDF